MVRWIIHLIAALFLLVILLTWSRIIPHFNDRGKPGAEAVIVLGAQVRRSGPSTVLRFRLDAAVSYLQENPDTVCIVSGSQGPNEPFTEAEGMKTYLIGKGIPEDRILIEKKAKSTAENIEFSMKMLSSLDRPVVIVSNDFHMYRALSIAKRLGCADISGRSAGSPRLFLLNNMLYESAANVKNTVQGNMNTRLEILREENKNVTEWEDI